MINKKTEFTQLKLKKYRHRLLCKKIINLKKNVQNKTKMMGFKKKKWQKFVEHSEKTLYTKTQLFKCYDQSSYYVSKSQIRFKWNYKNMIRVKKQFNFFYGYLLNKYIKTRVSLAIKKRRVLNDKFCILSKIFINFFEKRLDTILYRSYFAYSMRHAKQLISHNHIKINGKIVNINSYQVKNGDLISLAKKKKIILNIRSKISENMHIWPIPIKHLQINYRTYQITLTENLNADSLVRVFPFHLDLNDVIQIYK